MKKSYLSDNKKTTYIIDNLLIGGAQKHLLNLSRELSNKGYSIEIICLGASEQSLLKDYSKVKVYPIKMDCIWKLHFWRNFLHLIAYLKKDRPDIVHTYLNTSNVFGVFAGKLVHIPIVISSRRDLGHFRSKRIAILEKISANLSDKVICVSEAVRQSTIKKEGLALDKTTVLYNGIDTGIFTGRNKDRDRNYFNISMAAAMDREAKGHVYFIEAAEKIVNKRKDVRFTILGDGHLRPNLEFLIYSKGLKKYFNLKGRVNNVQTELRNADIFVVPSETEGCSNALLEAMAMGIPTIATAVEGNLEVIEDGISGFLVRPKNSSAIAQKILELLDETGIASSPSAPRNDLKKVGAEARERIAEKFTLDGMVKNYIKFYSNLMDMKRLNTLKIGYVVSLFPCWSETFILNEIIELQKKGIDITIFSIRSDLENFIQEKAKPFIKKTIYINKMNLVKSVFLWLIKKPLIVLSLLSMVMHKKYNNSRTLFKNIWSIFTGCFFAEVALKKGIRHIHAHFATYPTTTALAMSKLTGIPFSFTAHAHDIFLDKALLKEKSKEAKNIVVISNYNKRYISDYCKNGIGKKVKVIHCGVDLSDEVSLSKNSENIIISIGRLTKMKGFDYLINACEQLQAKTQFQCHIIGDGPLYNHLQRKIHNLGLNQNVFLEGIVDNTRVKKMLSNASILVLPCVWDNTEGQDGIPIVLMEAMALGVPVISSNISGIPELVEDRETGLLVKPGDEKQLAQKMLELITNKELQNRLSLKGKAKIEDEFNIIKTTEKLMEIFKN